MISAREDVTSTSRRIASIIADWNWQNRKGDTKSCIRSRIFFELLECSGEEGAHYSAIGRSSPITAHTQCAVFADVIAHRCTCQGWLVRWRANTQSQPIPRVEPGRRDEAQLPTPWSAPRLVAASFLASISSPSPPPPSTVPNATGRSPSLPLSSFFPLRYSSGTPTLSRIIVHLLFSRARQPFFPSLSFRFSSLSYTHA